MPKTFLFSRAAPTRRIKIKEWIYDYNSGNCIKFRTIVKTLSNTNSSQKIGKTLRKVKIGRRHSNDNNRVNAQKDLLPMELASECTSDDDSSFEDSTFKSAIDGILSPPLEESAFNTIDEDSDGPSVEEESQIQDLNETDPRNEEQSASHSNLQLPSEKDEDTPLDVDVPNDPQERNREGNHAVIEIENGPNVSTRDDSDAFGTSLLTKLKNADVINEEPSCVSFDVTAFRNMSCVEADFDLRNIDCDWDTIEKLMHKAEILSYYCHSISPTCGLPDTITVLGTQGNVHQLQLMLERISCWNGTVESQYDTASNSTAASNSKVSDITVKTSESLILNEIKRLDDLMFGEMSGNYNPPMSKEATEKVVAALNDLVSKATWHLNLMETSQDYQLHEDFTDVVPLKSSVSSEKEQLLCGVEDRKYKEFEDRIASEVLDEAEPKRQLDSKTENSEVAVGDTCNSGDCSGNSNLNDDTVKAALDNAMKAAASSAVKDSSVLSLHLSESGNLESAVPPREICNLCTCFETKLSPKNTMLDTETSPVLNNGNHPKIHLPLPPSLSHYGPMPSKFKLKFDHDVKCHVFKSRGTWHIQCQDGESVLAESPEFHQDQVDTRFSSNGRRFKFAFANDGELLRATAVVRDQQRGPPSRAGKKSPMTIF